MKQSSRNRTIGISGGRRLSESTPRPNEMGKHRLRANGLKVRAAVVATYVQRDEAAFPAGGPTAAVAVYCDVITYGVSEGLRPSALRRVPVFTDSGMHDGRVWKPRAATVDIVESDLDIELSQPADLDGDHVLIEYMEDDLAQPFISRRINHPRMGLGNDTVPGGSPGHRMLLEVADGDPDFWKHHGSYYGFNDKGDFEVNTVRAHEGDLDSSGNEVPSDDANHGNVHYRVAHNAKLVFEGTDPDDADRKWIIEVDGAAGTVAIQIDNDADGNNEVDVLLDVAGVASLKLDPNSDGTNEIEATLDAQNAQASLTMDSDSDGNDEINLVLDSAAKTIQAQAVEGNDTVEMLLDAVAGTVRNQTATSGVPTTKMELLGPSKRLNIELGDGTEVTLALDNSGGLDIDVNGGDTLHVQQNGSNATLTLGDGAVPVAIADPYLKAQLENIISIYNGHTHDVPEGKAASATTTAVTGGGGGTGSVTITNETATASSPGDQMDPYDSNIESGRLLIPDA